MTPRSSIMPLEEAQLYFNAEGIAQSIELFVDNPDAGRRAAPADRGRRPAGRSSSPTGAQRNQTFFSALQVERNVMFMILTLIVLVAALNIISGLIMLVKDKGSDIAILRTMGATSGSIMRIFFMTGAAIGIVGTFAGVLLGVVVCLNVESIRQFFSWISGTTLFDPELYFLSQLPAEMNLERDDLGRRHGAQPVLPRHDLSGMARLAPRSGPGPAIRIDEDHRHDECARGIAAFRRRAPLRPGRHACCRSSRVRTSRCRAARSSRSWRRPAPASRRFCISRACWSGRMAARSWSTADPAALLDDEQRTAIRRNEIGFVYQFHHLLPEFTALENIMMPQLIAGLGKAEARERAAQLLDYMRIGHRAEHRPSELSGGEQQRVAIARAVANAPLVLLADEPTGNLDPETAGYVFEALEALVRQSGLAALIATHNHELASRMDRRVTIEDGKVVEL